MSTDLNLDPRNPDRIPPPEGSENLNPSTNPSLLLDSDPSRPPLNTIQEPYPNPRPPKTPSKNRTLEKPALVPPLARGLSLGTPPAHRPGAGKASSVQSDCSSTQSTPTKCIVKPAFSRLPEALGPRAAEFAVAQVPHFELKENPAFWMDHNMQVVIRVRPLNSAERSLQGYNRCLKQDSAQSISLIGQPESRFTFDYVACETANQEMLFQVAGLPMVENCMSGYNSCMFAYGQTGSGKTYTMLGEIGELEFRPSPERGLTPRIFEFLFARIRAEEESRRDEKLKYSCKCSFLEIYNEQITDLLDPSSTNLLLREDSRKGVYVDNLSEFEVETVNDILKHLFQGAANRRVAATNVNCQSSRSHSVFTCVIESKWEKDSTTNLRSARLNLVDLAGSERQKTSGAKGERLKEAAYINKSLSTLGHVIMALADLANGKRRHVPYRDSRLTFLLQDSLGGNSKAMIIANVSPSIGSTNETLSTLKFAQRARLVRNNAVVNEDTSGDVISLQYQISLLKDELFVLKRHNVLRSLSFCPPMEDSKKGECDSVDELHGDKTSHSLRVSAKELKSLKALLTAALRREQMAETTIKQLEAEIEQLNHLIGQREEFTLCSKMMLKFREEKIHRLEAFLDGRLPSDSYLLNENNTLKEEIQLLRARVDRNPEVTRFALENIRLLHQLSRFQDFYEGERELLLTEVSQLRHQLMQVFDGNFEGHLPKPDTKPQVALEAEDPQLADSKDNQLLRVELKKTSQELEHCRNKLKFCLEINARLTREMNNLHTELTTIKPASHDQTVNVEPEDTELCLDSLQSGHILTHRAKEILNLQLELDILKTVLGEAKSSQIEAEERAFLADSKLEATNQRVLQISKRHQDTEKELKDARSVIKFLESQHILSLNELEESLKSNSKLVELLKKKEQEMSILGKQPGVRSDVDEKLKAACEIRNKKFLTNPENEDSPSQEKLKRMRASLEEARILNSRFLSDEASQTSLEQEKDEVCRQAEDETTEVIVYLQKELTTLQELVDDSNRNELLAKESLMTLEIEMKELRKKFTSVTQENERLSGMLERNEKRLTSLTEDWASLAYEIAEVLSDGNLSLQDASDQVATISEFFPDSNWVTENVGKMIRSISERDLLIEGLQKCLEDAENLKCDMKWKLRSLRGATLAITEALQQESNDKEKNLLQLTSDLDEKIYIISELEKNQMLFQAESEKRIEALEAQLEQCQEQNTSLLKQIKKSLRQNQALGKQLTVEEESVGDDISEAKTELNKFKVGVSMLHSCMSECVEEVSCATEEYTGTADCRSEHGVS